MTLSDHTTAHNPESNSAVATETDPTASEQTSTEQRSSELKSTDSNVTEEHPSTPSHAPAPSFAEATHACDLEGAGGLRLIVIDQADFGRGTAHVEG